MYELMKIEIDILYRECPAVSNDFDKDVEYLFTSSNPIPRLEKQAFSRMVPSQALQSYAGFNTLMIAIAYRT
jgi:hypothetical protein